MLSNGNDIIRDIHLIAVEGRRKKRGNAGSSGYKGKTRLNMLFSPTLPAKTTQKVMLKRKMLNNRNANGKASFGQVMLMPSIVNAKKY